MPLMLNLRSMKWRRRLENPSFRKNLCIPELVVSSILEFLRSLAPLNEKCGRNLHRQRANSCKASFAKTQACRDTATQDISKRRRSIPRKGNRNGREFDDPAGKDCLGQKAHRSVG